MRAKTSNKVIGFKQHMGGAIGEGALELVDDQAVAIDAQAVFGNGRSGHVAAHPFELCALTRLAGDGAVERKAISSDGVGFDECVIVHRPRVV